MLMECKEIIRLEGVTKRFPGVVALNGVSFLIERGSVHPLMGENGAGKSTLIKVLSGTYTDYEGEIFVNGEKIRFMNENDAILHGISVVPQELHAVLDAYFGSDGIGYTLCRSHIQSCDFCLGN